MKLSLSLFVVSTLILGVGSQGLRGREHQKQGSGDHKQDERFLKMGASKKDGATPTSTPRADTSSRYTSSPVACPPEWGPQCAQDPTPPPAVVPTDVPGPRSDDTTPGPGPVTANVCQMSLIFPPNTIAPPLDVDEVFPTSAQTLSGSTAMISTGTVAISGSASGYARGKTGGTVYVNLVVGTNAPSCSDSIAMDGTVTPGATGIAQPISALGTSPDQVISCAMFFKINSTTLQCTVFTTPPTLPPATDRTDDTLGSCVDPTPVSEYYAELATLPGRGPELVPCKTNDGCSDYKSGGGNRGPPCCIFPRCLCGYENPTANAFCATI
jgi:hypothetical protein